MQSFRAIGSLFMDIFMDILHCKEDLGDASVISECSLGVNVVIDFFLCSFRYFTSV